MRDLQCVGREPNALQILNEGDKIMLKKILRFRTVLILLLGMSLFYSNAFADRHDREHNRGYFRGDRGYNRNNVWGHGRYYRNGGWYRHGWFGSEMPVPMFDGVVVGSLPSNCTTVGIQDNAYYLCGNQYFRPMPGGGYMEGSEPNSYVFNSN